MTYKGFFRSLMRTAGVVLLQLAGIGAFLYPQTAPNTPVSNQAKALYQYRSLPKDSVNSNVVLFTVLDAPNFEMSFRNDDSLTFGKDTVTIRIVYTNVGNKSADSAVIEGILPAAGFRFIPGSTGGTITGNMVRWKVLNVPSGRSDSVKVKVVVDSTLTVNTQLNMQANLSWQSSSINSEKTFVIAALPRLVLNIIPDQPVIGSGRTNTYRFVVSNTGNTPSANTVVYDTLSLYAAFAASVPAPDSISVNKRIMKWNIGSVPAFSAKEFTMSVKAEPNLGHTEIRNSARVNSANVPAVVLSSAVTPVVPILPKTISISPVPDFLFGQLNKDSSRITVLVKDSLNESLPEGTPVQFSSSIGRFTNGASSVSTMLQNGSAAAVLRSIDVNNDIVASTITVVGGEPAVQTIRDSAVVNFYPGAVTGIVVNGGNRVPFQGAFARVFNSQRTIVGSDTTGADGRFFIALNKDVAKYTLEILVIDKFGDTVSTVGEIDPSRFPLPPIIIPNIISGRIEYKVTGRPAPAQNVTVYLDSLGPTPSARVSRTRPLRNTAGQNSAIRVQESTTDANGKFKFENLKPARYIISLDSAEFPNFNGFTFLTDTGAGTFTINLSLQITLDSSITLTTSAPAEVNAGDTVEIGIGVHNSGTSEHRSVVLTDTLPPFVAFVSASPGMFSSVTFDSAANVLRWNRDTLRTLQKDSVTLRFAVSGNIPDRTILRNRIWFNSSIKQANAAMQTLVRSRGEIVFENLFIVPKDTIIAGDSIIHVFRFRNVGTDSIRKVRIIDTLFSAGTVGTSMFKSANLDSLQIVDSISTIYIGSLAPGAVDSVTLKLITDFALRQGTSVASHAYMLAGDSIIAHRDTLFIIEEHPNLPSFISIVKTANKKVAEIGDIVTYQIQVSNSSPKSFHSVGVYDMLPYAFKYIRNSARFNGRAIEPLLNPELNQLTWMVPDTVPSAKSAVLVYQLAIGADALESEGMNTAIASAVAGGGTTLVSAPSQWQVTVRPGVFTEKGLIIGKVFYDDNRNTFQDEGENGEKGIELWMEDGTKIITGNDGKFSLPEVKPGQHVMRVNEHTLPKAVTLIAGNNAFANDPVSRFVRVTESGIAKANFFLKRSISDSIVQSLSKVNKLIAVRQAKPKYLFEDTLRMLRQDTVSIYVSFAFSGNKPLRSFVVTDRWDDRMALVPNSSSFNGVRINPALSSDSVVWNIVPDRALKQGVLSYKLAVKKLPSPKTVLMSYSIVNAETVDSLILRSAPIAAENVVLDTMKNRIETSDIFTAVSDPGITNHLSDSVHVASGDDVFFKTTLYIDPKKKVKEAMVYDSLPASFMINERTVMVNGIPVPSRNLTIRIRSMALTSSARMRMENQDIEFIRISTLDVTDLLRNGKNEITFTARMQSVKKDTMYRKHTFAVVTDEFDEKSLLHSREAKIYVKAHNGEGQLLLETTFVDIPRPSVKVEEKVADAVKLVESLRSGTSTPVVMEGISFELSKATLTGDSKIVLDNIAAILLANPDIRIQINGYTDNTGNAVANRKMSLNRAKEVAAYLVSKGVETKRLLPQGFGPSKPIASNKTEEGRSKNRRVEFAPIQ